MLKSLKLITFPAGDIILREDDKPGGIYIIKNGEVEISRIKDDEIIILGKRKDDDIFGEMALVDDSPRTATVTAITDTSCYIIDKKTFNKYLKKLDPIVIKIFRSMSSTIREMNETQTMMANILEIRKK